MLPDVARSPLFPSPSPSLTVQTIVSVLGPDFHLVGDGSLDIRIYSLIILILLLVLVLIGVSWVVKGPFGEWRRFDFLDLHFFFRIVFLLHPLYLTFAHSHRSTDSQHAPACFACLRSHTPSPSPHTHTARRLAVGTVDMFQLVILVIAMVSLPIGAFLIEEDNEFTGLSSANLGENMKPYWSKTNYTSIFEGSVVGASREAVGVADC